MKTITYFLTVIFILTSCSSIAYAASIPYCTHNGERPANRIENKLLQKLIPDFAKEMQCEIGTNCLGKWNNQENPTKFSIAWAKQCGPIISGQYQLGDEGHGSTFTCQKNLQTGKTCCAPLGYEYVDKWVVCG